MGRAGFGVAAGCAAAACAIAAVLVARRASARARWRRAVALLRDFEDGCATPPARLRQVVDAMVVEMHAGLASDGGSKLKMLLTFVDALPNGYGPQGPLSLLRPLSPACCSVRSSPCDSSLFAALLSFSLFFISSPILRRQIKNQKPFVSVIFIRRTNKQILGWFSSVVGSCPSIAPSCLVSLLIYLLYARKCGYLGSCLPNDAELTGFFFSSLNSFSFSASM